MGTTTRIQRVLPQFSINSDIYMSFWYSVKDLQPGCSSEDKSRYKIGLSDCHEKYDSSYLTYNL